MAELNGARFSMTAGDGTAAPGALSVLSLWCHNAQQLDRALTLLGRTTVRTGGAALRDLSGIDSGMVIRWSDRHACITPHGGAVTLQRLREALCVQGWIEAAPEESPAGQLFPEASGTIEAMALCAMARAPSPLAVDVLAMQADRWCRHARAPLADEERIAAHSRVLNRLLTPPRVVVIGAPNVGKSTLTNRLAQRAVSIVADEPGTTRDHVGVRLDVGGLVVAWIDTPGLRTQSKAASEAGDTPVLPVETAAIERVSGLIDAADLLVLCGDARAGVTPEAQRAACGHRGVLRCATRADLLPAGARAPWADVTTSASTGAGISDLAAMVREALLPRSAVCEDVPWMFDERLAAR